MTKFLSALLKIITLRNGPQSLPAYWSVLVVALSLWVAAVIVSATIQGDGAAVAGAGIITLILSTLFVWGLLSAFHQPQRLVQTMSAIIGCGALLSLLISPLVWQIGLDPENVNPTLGSMVFTVLIWSVVVDGHILRHALSIGHFSGALLAILMFSVNQTVTAFLVRDAL